MRRGTFSPGRNIPDSSQDRLMRAFGDLKIENVSLSESGVLAQSAFMMLRCQENSFAEPGRILRSQAKGSRKDASFVFAFLMHWIKRIIAQLLYRDDGVFRVRQFHFAIWKSLIFGVDTLQRSKVVTQKFHHL
jgi:hypothetical protein